MSRKLSTWSMIVFFALEGIAAFVPSLHIPWLVGAAALAAAVFLILDR